MSNWPQTCNYCGAPLQGARCPRCSFERKPFGEVVLSGYVEGAGGAVVTPLVYEAIGTDTGSGTSITLSVMNLTVQAGTLLCCYVAAANDGTLAVFPSVTWGATPLAQTNPGGNSVILTDTFVLLVSATATANLTISLNDPALEAISIIVFRLIGATQFVQGAHQDNTGTGDDDTITTFTAGSNATPNLIAVYNSFDFGPTTDTGTWAAPATVQQGVSLVGNPIGGGAQGWISQASRAFPTGFISGTESSRQLAAPAAYWLVDGNLYK